MKKVLITSGGTISRIDDVRHIGNFSKGTTGAIIAEEFLNRGWNVDYLYGSGAARPYRRQMVVDPSKNLESEVNRIEKVMGEFHQNNSRLNEFGFDDFDNYYSLVRDSLISQTYDCVILSAAVSDYSAKKVDGKISSDEDNLVINLDKNLKVISRIREWHPDTYLVGFKLLSGVSSEKLVDVAYNNCVKNGCDLTVANLLNGGDLMNSETYFVFPTGEFKPVQRKYLARDLVLETEKLNFDEDY